jgi:ABC-type multidrug transport system fused ATPase/permease subunit
MECNVHDDALCNFARVFARSRPPVKLLQHVSLALHAMCPRRSMTRIRAICEVRAMQYSSARTDHNTISQGFLRAPARPRTVYLAPSARNLQHNSSSQFSESPNTNEHMAQASVMTNPPAVKACILGESGAGKSSLVLLQTTGEFHGNQPTTIGAAYLTWIPRNRRCKLEVW